jgi:hypothetical protein
LRPRGRDCNSGGSDRLNRSIIPNIQGKGVESLNGGLDARSNLESSSLCGESLALGPPKLLCLPVLRCMPWGLEHEILNCLVEVGRTIEGVVLRGNPGSF